MEHQKLHCLVLTFDMQVQLPTNLQKMSKRQKNYELFMLQFSPLLYNGSIPKMRNLTS